MDAVRHFEQQQVKDTQRPFLRAGDVVRVETRIQEGDKTRLQAFEGTVLSIRGSGPSATFTVRREAGHFGVERIFPLYSPAIASINVVKRQKVRRAKLSYLRQAGRRRFKEDVKAMQRLVQEEEGLKRKASAAEARADKEAAEKKQSEEEAKNKEGVQAEDDTADGEGETVEPDKEV